MTCETEFDIIIIAGNCLEQMEMDLPVAGIGSFLLPQKQAIANRNKKRIVERSYQMDVLRMKVLLERYRQLKIRIENSRHRICRIKASSFEQYIEEKTYHSPLGERRLQGGKPCRVAGKECPCRFDGKVMAINHVATTGMSSSSTGRSAGCPGSIRRWSDEAGAL